MNTPLKHFLNSLARRVTERIPSINHGGCGVFASLVGYRLSALTQVDSCSIIVAQYKASKACLNKARSEILTNQQDISDVYVWNDTECRVVFGHVMILFSVDGQLYTYDSTGVRKGRRRIVEGMEIYKGEMSINEMANLANNPNGWNSSFNRKTMIPRLEKIVDHCFDQYENATV